MRFEAISEIGKRWREIIATYGSQAIMPYSYLGNMGLVQGINSGDPFFNRLGTTVNEKTFCASGSSTAWLLTVGPTGGVVVAQVVPPFVRPEAFSRMATQVEPHRFACLAKI